MTIKRTLLAVVVCLALACGTANASALGVATVTAVPLWTDTGLTVSGYSISISAAGVWDWGGGPTGPDGDFFYGCSGYDEFEQNCHHGQLIAFVGANPYAGTVNVDYYGIGSSGSIPNGLSGELWLGFNDDRESGATEDNSGSVEAVMTPELSSIGLLVFGLTGLGLLKKRSR